MGISQRNLTPIFFSFGKSFAKALKVPSGEYCLMLASYNIPVAKSAFVTGGNLFTTGSPVLLQAITRKTTSMEKMFFI